MPASFTGSTSASAFPPSSSCSGQAGTRASPSCARQSGFRCPGPWLAAPGTTPLAGRQCATR
eukprot:2990916-Pyramimonas_sp.AAC.1